MSVSIRDLMTDPALLGSEFGGPSWAPWRTLLAGFYGLQLSDCELPLWERLTGRSDAPSAPFRELWQVIGRRGGKSRAAALLAVYEALFVDRTDRLAAGEVATVMLMAADRAQAANALRYVRGLLHLNPMFARMILRESAEGIELSNRTILAVQTASYRAVRGYSVAAVIADEIAFWRADESANPDVEIIAALRPALATLGGKLIALSSPYAKRGALWDTYRRHYGQPGPVLVAQAPSRVMNPELAPWLIEDAMQRDPAVARSEYLAQFRSDLADFVQREQVEALVRGSPIELTPEKRHRYIAFVDPSGGGADEFTLAIAHREDDRVVVDLVRARSGAPAEIVAEYAPLLRAYRVTRVQSDRYAGRWPADEFSRYGISCEQSARPKSELYRDLLPVMLSGRLELPPDDRLICQLSALERRTSRGGRDHIDHPPGSHDDRANALAGVVALAGVARTGYRLEAETIGSCGPFPYLRASYR